jgi:hypothetical protein
VTGLGRRGRPDPGAGTGAGERAGAEADFYRVNADLYDAVSVELWEALRPALLGALAEARAADGPIVDVGAGTGLATAVIAEAVPEASILAVEPSAALRPGLMARVMTLPGLRERVTVLPTDLAGAVPALPRRLGGVVAMNMLGHLDPAARRAFWALLAERLAPGAPAVIGLQPPERPEVVPPAGATRVRVGDRWYEGSGSAAPSGPESVRWRMTWRVLGGEAGEQLLEERVAETEWWTVGRATVIGELARAGLRATAGEAGLVVARPPAAG